MSSPQPAGHEATGCATLGSWLRAQRLAQGWAVAELARRLCQTAKAAGDNAIVSASIMATYVRRWERDKTAPTERYRLLYCAVLSLAPGQFGLTPPHPDANNTAPGSPPPAPGSDSRQGGDVGGVMVMIPDNCPHVTIHIYRCGTANAPA